ncbi:ribonuclease H-like domain-containing protein, partial [Tanacetum coccineum]
MNQPDGFVDPHYPEKVYHLKKALYGLKQAPQAWYDELSNFLLSKEFSKVATKPLDVDLSGTLVDQMKYRSMIGSLMYLSASRPDIVYATCYCARYQARPTIKHLKEVKRIFRYLKNTIHMGLWYPKDTGFNLTAFLEDFDHTGLSRIRYRKSNLWGYTIYYGWYKLRKLVPVLKAGLHFELVRKQLKPGLYTSYFEETPGLLKLSETLCLLDLKQIGMRVLTSLDDKLK